MERIRKVLSFQQILPLSLQLPSQLGMLRPNSPLPKRLQKVTQRQLHQQQHLRHRQPQQPRQLHKLHQHKLHRHPLDQRAAVCGTSHPPLQRPGPRTSQRLLSPIAQSHRHSRHQSPRPSPRTPRPRRPQRVESRRTATTMGTRVRTATATAHRAPTAHARVPMSPTPDPKPVPDPSKTRTSGGKRMTPSGMVDGIGRIGTTGMARLTVTGGVETGPAIWIAIGGRSKSVLCLLDLQKLKCFFRPVFHHGNLEEVYISQVWLQAGSSLRMNVQELHQEQR